MGIAGLSFAVLWPPAGTSPVLAGIGFAIVLATSGVQLAAPRQEWVQVEESLASISGVLIIGFGPAVVTPLTLLWLTAVASGVLARGGRAHWVGRALLLIALAMPIVRHQTVNPRYACLCLAAIALLLTCGRVTQELRKMLDQARYDADHDGLTGALSRTAFRDQLDRIAAQAGDDGAAALLLVDLDNFGQVNKTAGHAAGDALLRFVVERLHAAVGADSVVGRLGGDEFAAIVRTEDPERLGQTLLADLNHDDPTDGQPAIHASLGMALIPRDGDDAEGFLRAVDVALRVAKRSGGHQLSVYAGESFSDHGPGGARETLERLISGEGLAVVMQPIVSVSTGTPHAFEALARFQTRGTSSPLHWFALADEFGVRDRLELACLRAALRHLHDRPAGTALSVNLSGPLLLDRRTAELLDATGAGRTDPRADREQPARGHPRAARRDLAAAGARGALRRRRHGRRVLGLRQITTLRPSYLKLDRSLISGIDADPDRGALVTAMLGYARQTNGHLVAEGVETEAELETLRVLGVDLVQGYYLARPGWPWPEVHQMVPGAVTTRARLQAGSADRVPAPRG